MRFSHRFEIKNPVKVYAHLSDWANHATLYRQNYAAEISGKVLTIRSKFLFIKWVEYFFVSSCITQEFCFVETSNVGTGDFNSGAEYVITPDALIVTWYMYPQNIQMWLLLGFFEWYMKLTVVKDIKKMLHEIR